MDTLNGVISRVGHMASLTTTPDYPISDSHHSESKEEYLMTEFVLEDGLKAQTNASYTKWKVQRPDLTWGGFARKTPAAQIISPLHKK